MNLRSRLNDIIFKADTPAGKAFDIALIVSVLASVLAVLLHSVASIEKDWGTFLRGTEWFFTILFTLEYLLRLYAVERTVKYTLSFFGIIDLLAILPTYLEPVLPFSRFLRTIRILRVLRIFHVLNSGPFIRETRDMLTALKSSFRKIVVFLLVVFVLVVFLGSLMYTIEGGQAQTTFTSIPRSIYWAIVTLTTVGYGDISPMTPLGQALAALIMILGYSIIVVPTGFVSVEMVRSSNASSRTCGGCDRSGHDNDASHCKYCGRKLP
ncbi:ion transporter [Planctomycetota bacterium]